MACSTSAPLPPSNTHTHRHSGRRPPAGVDDGVADLDARLGRVAAHAGHLQAAAGRLGLRELEAQGLVNLDLGGGEGGPRGARRRRGGRRARAEGGGRLAGGGRRWGRAGAAGRCRRPRGHGRRCRGRAVLPLAFALPSASSPMAAADAGGGGGSNCGKRQRHRAPGATEWRAVILHRTVTSPAARTATTLRRATRTAIRGAEPALKEVPT
jgi:hypothetical protein